MKVIGKVSSFDEMVDALGDVQRRRLLVSLLDHNPQPVPRVDVAESGVETEDMGRVISMQHAHLPKLADYGFIEWDSDRHEVTKGPAFEEIRPLLELLKGHEDELPEDWI